MSIIIITVLISRTIVVSVIIVISNNNNALQHHHAKFCKTFHRILQFEKNILKNAMYFEEQ